MNFLRNLRIRYYRWRFKLLLKYLENLREEDPKLYRELIEEWDES